MLQKFLQKENLYNLMMHGNTQTQCKKFIAKVIHTMKEKKDNN